MKFIFLIIFPVAGLGQFSDTLIQCKAWTNTFLPTHAFGLTSNGHLYNVAFVNHYGSNNSKLEADVVKLDLIAGTATYKVMPHSLSDGFLWQWIEDTLGNFYFGLNASNRRIWKFNFKKDSIQATNLGNGFLDGQALAYSYGLDWHNHVYFGASSGGTYWSEYDPSTNKLTKHPEIYTGHQYVLSITGDDDYVYAQTGQMNDIRLYAIRKFDNQKTLLFKIPNFTRFNLRQRQEGVYVSFNTDTLSGTYRLYKGIASRQNFPNPAVNIEEAYREFEDRREDAYFDDKNAQMVYTVASPLRHAPNTVIAVKVDSIENTVGRVFAFQNDTTHIYYSGSIYGAFYDYNKVTNTVTKLGSTGLNLCSTLPVNDSIMFLGNYPNGTLVKWNRNKPWTLLTFQNGKVVQLSKSSNPSVCGTFRSYAGFHHCTLLIQDKYGNIVGAGGVIRTGNTCSIGVYNPLKDSMYGYDNKKIDRLAESNLAVYGKYILFSTNNTNGGAPKIYYYNPSTNQMDDSLTISGYTNYGNIFVIGDLLIGSVFGDTSNHYLGKLYKVDLRTKKVLMSAQLNAAIGSSGIADDGKYYINTTATNIPEDFWKVVKINYNDFSQCGNMLCRPYRNSIICVKKLLGDHVDLNSPAGRRLYVKYLSGNN